MSPALTTVVARLASDWPTWDANMPDSAIRIIGSTAAASWPSTRPRSATPSWLTTGRTSCCQVA